MLLNFKIKNKIIKWLGGYTQREFSRETQKYEALLHSKSNTPGCPELANEKVEQVLESLINYAKEVLYGLPSDEWSRRMYNCLNNNRRRILTNYICVGSSILYPFDTTIDNHEQFIQALKEDSKNKSS